MIFVDGFHTFDATLCDMMMGLRLLRVGGVMIIDDCRMPPVAKAVAYFQNYDCIKTVGSSPNNSGSISRFFSRVAGKIPKNAVVLLPSCIYNFLYPHSWMSTMMVLRKVDEDDRHWNWYRNF